MAEFNLNPITLTQSLVKCQSITPKDDGALLVVQDHLSSMGFDCSQLLFSGNGSYEVKNLFATIGSNGPHLAFAGHTDVVPPGNESSWKHPPFSAIIEDNKLYGRGTEDMKSNIACFISATEKFLKKNGKNFGGKISYIITGDEEGEAINGTPQIMEWTKKQNIKIDHCLVGEPTSNTKIGDKVKIGRRGSVNFFLTVKGVQGHTANGHRAQNPVHCLTKLISNILEKPLDEGNEFFLPTAIQIPTFDVGNPAHNVIPEYASATINIRFNDIHTPESLIQWLNEKIELIFTNMENATCKVKHEISARSFLNKPGDLSKIVSKSISQATGRNEEPELATDGGTSDARFIKNYCEVIELGIRNQTLHQVDEFVFLDDLNELTKIYYKILENYFSKS
ncbi:succinyl-diaminopimelate desuccinylase [Pelagibacteraceae bacterium]|nr:succinyl-diaminopimelate desuccinylase [Pelagibacteraceae bacterium]